jgi:hypothetical protein
MLRFAFVGGLAVSVSRPVALRTDLAVGVPLSEGDPKGTSVLRDARLVLLLAGYVWGRHCRPFTASEPSRGSELWSVIPSSGVPPERMRLAHRKPFALLAFESRITASS